MIMATQETIQTEQNHSQSLADNGMYVFMGDVDDDGIKPVVEWVLYENYVTKKKKKELLLMICSGGGDMGAAFALIDVMMSSQIPIKTVGLGTIASAGLLIFISGTHGRRVLTPNTSILSHQFSWYNEGKVHELFATMKEFELTRLECWHTMNCVQDWVEKKYARTYYQHRMYGFQHRKHWPWACAMISAY